MLNLWTRLKSAWVENGDWLNGLALAGIFALAAATLVIQDQTSQSFALNTPGWMSVFVLLIISYLVLCWARGASLWASFTSERRDKVQRRDSENPFGELFIYLIAALFALSSMALASAGSSSLWFWTVNLSNRLNVLLFFGAVFVSFLPLIIAFRAHVTYAYGKNIFLNHISNESLAFGFALMGLIAVLAWVAGRNMIPTDRAFGAIIMLIVLALFMCFIAVPYVHSFLLGKPNKKVNAEGEPVPSGFVPTNPASIASWFDGLLVRKLAPLTGATQKSFWPHLLLVCVFTPFTIMGYALPAPYGLVPIFFALVLAIALGRRWAWVENDRETAMRLHSTQENMRVGFRNDLRDEALLGYAFLFVLVPLALRQLQLWIEPFDSVEGIVSNNNSLTDWAQFFGIELAKAVPIVDWADIYGIQPEVPFQATDAFSKHLVFASRLMVDLVIIAALLQAWGIMQRNSSQMQLFKDGQLDLLDPFTEEAHFNRGVEIDDEGETQFTDALNSLFKAHAEGSLKLGRGRIPYNQKRLTEILIRSDQPEMKAMVNKLADDYSILVGKLRDQICMLADRWRGSSDADWLDEDSVREQRLTFERLLEDAQEETDPLGLKHCKALASMLARVSHATSFYNAKVSAYKLLSRQSSVHAVQTFITSLINSEGKFGLAETKFDRRFKNPSEWTFAREPLWETRVEIIRSIGQFLEPRGSSQISNRALKLCEQILCHAAQNETDKVREIANELLVKHDF